jgi:hypothetical protein
MNFGFKVKKPSTPQQDTTKSGKEKGDVNGHQKAMIHPVADDDIG